METLLEQLERFAEVLAVSRTPHAGSWGRETVRRSLSWARYLRHLHGRFRHGGRLPAALQEGLRRGRPGEDEDAAQPRRARPGAFGGPLRGFDGLGRGDQLLALGLLENAALPSPALHELLRHLRGAPEGPAALPGRLAQLARRRAASQLLLLGPGSAQAAPALRATEADLLLLRLREEAAAGPGAEARLLDRLWARLPQPPWLSVLAQALLRRRPAPERRRPEAGDPDEAAPAALLAWVLARPPVQAALCRFLPGPLLSALLGRHPPLAAACLDLLTAWGSCLTFDLARGAWVGGGPEGPTWPQLRECFRCFCGAPPPLSHWALARLQAAKARDGGFEAPGLSVWTDLLRDVGAAEDAQRPPRAPPRSDF